MARYVYVGWGPETGPDGELARPLDEREFDEQPTWGRWSELIEPESAPPPPKGNLAETPPELAAQGIFARGATAADDKPAGGE